MSTKVPVTLITFDVDGTLVKTKNTKDDTNPHSQAFIHAAGKHFTNTTEFECQYTTPLEIIPLEKYHGCTDGLIILNTIKYAFGISADESSQQLNDLFHTMYNYFTNLTDDEVAAGIIPLSGVIETLKQLADIRKSSDNVLIGLVTGNVEGIARIKMRACGIHSTEVFSIKSTEQVFDGEPNHSFLGGFGSDYCSCDIEDDSRPQKDRGEQIAIAYRRALSLLREDQELVRVVHVGDAPADVLAAKWCYQENKFAAHVTVGCVGVATGSFSAEKLKDLAGESIPGKWEPVVLVDGLADPDFIASCGIVTQTD